MQAVASQTLRQSSDLKTANDALAFRLAAFGRAADILTASNWEDADLHALLRTALAPHESVANRFDISGPPIMFQSSTALALTLAFHDNKNQTIADPKSFAGKDAPSRARRVIQADDTLFSTVRTYLKNIALVPAELSGQLT